MPVFKVECFDAGQKDGNGTLSSPIVEMFEQKDQLDHTLKTALAELEAQEIGSGAMTTALLKQVLVTILRRSLCSSGLWVERFSMLSDPQIARAFSDMVAVRQQRENTPPPDSSAPQNPMMDKWLGHPGRPIQQEITI